MKNLYGHWLRDAQLPSPVGTTRTLRYASKAVAIRTRFASAYLRIAEALGPSDDEIWMDLALREGNIANLLAFLTSKLGDHELPDDALAEAEAAQRDQENLVEALERQDIRTSTDAEHYMRSMVSSFHTDADAIARALAYFFPVVPVAMKALRETGATALEHVASWIETHTWDVELRSGVAQLRKDAAQIRHDVSTRPGSP